MISSYDINVSKIVQMRAGHSEFCNFKYRNITFFVEVTNNNCKTNNHLKLYTYAKILQKSFRIRCWYRKKLNFEIWIILTRILIFSVNKYSNSSIIILYIFDFPFSWKVINLHTTTGVLPLVRRNSTEKDLKFKCCSDVLKG